MLILFVYIFFNPNLKKILYFKYIQKTVGAVRRLTAIIQMFIGTQISCSQRHFKMNTLKKSMKINHWG
jgi:hypothetical protein